MAFIIEVCILKWGLRQVMGKQWIGLAMAAMPLATISAQASPALPPFYTHRNRKKILSHQLVQYTVVESF